MVFFCFCQTSITPGEKHVLSCRNSMRMLSTNYFLISYALERKSEETNANPQTGLHKYHNEACLHLTLPQVLPCGLRESRSAWKWRCLYCSDGSIHSEDDNIMDTKGGWESSSLPSAKGKGIQSEMITSAPSLVTGERKETLQVPEISTSFY